MGSRVHVPSQRGFGSQSPLHLPSPGTHLQPRKIGNVTSLCQTEPRQPADLERQASCPTNRLRNCQWVHVNTYFTSLHLVTTSRELPSHVPGYDTALASKKNAWRCRWTTRHVCSRTTMLHVRENVQNVQCVSRVTRILCEPSVLRCLATQPKAFPNLPCNPPADSLSTKLPTLLSVLKPTIRFDKIMV